ncbi:MAG: hypothetical protein JXQ75_11830 [Phycisphaerae bacterium]|nr:hypothetical protein [Phycisphaerae bacterium]
MADLKNDRERELSSDLLGYHLGIADEETRTRIEAVLGDDEAIASARETLRKILAPLDADEVLPPPPDLVANILDRVEEAKNILPLRQPDPAKAASVLPASEGSGKAGRPFLVMREVVGLAAAILIFVGILAPGYQTARMAGQRMACANNLRQVGNGYAQYAETYGSFLPYAGAVPPDAYWVQPSKPGAPCVSNSRHAFRLVRGRFTPSRAFNCPARDGDVVLDLDSPGDPRDLQGLDDFPDPRNNSFSMNFVTKPYHQNDFVAEMPIAADMTPLVDQDRRLVPLGKIPLNSLSHGSLRGQNVLRADISVRFFRKPQVGVDHDDIYRLIGVEQYTGLERPKLPNDVFLIP